MKKILTLAILLTFCMEPLAFASSDVADTASAAARVKMVQNEDPAINLDAFENNYQEAVESSASKVVLSPIEQIFTERIPPFQEKFFTRQVMIFSRQVQRRKLPQVNLAILIS